MRDQNQRADPYSGWWEKKGYAAACDQLTSERRNVTGHIKGTFVINQFSCFAIGQSVLLRLALVTRTIVPAVYVEQLKRCQLRRRIWTHDLSRVMGPELLSTPRAFSKSRQLLAELRERGAFFGGSEREGMTFPTFPPPHAPCRA